jgi:hypothetical protein
MKGKNSLVFVQKTRAHLQSSLEGTAQYSHVQKIPAEGTRKCQVSTMSGTETKTELQNKQKKGGGVEDVAQW